MFFDILTVIQNPVAAAHQGAFLPRKTDLPTDYTYLHNSLAVSAHGLDFVFTPTDSTKYCDRNIKNKDCDVPGQNIPKGLIKFVSLSGVQQCSNHNTEKTM